MKGIDYALQCALWSKALICTFIGQGRLLLVVSVFFMFIIYPVDEGETSRLLPVAGRFRSESFFPKLSANWPLNRTGLLDCISELHLWKKGRRRGERGEKEKGEKTEKKNRNLVKKCLTLHSVEYPSWLWLLAESQRPLRPPRQDSWGGDNSWVVLVEMRVRVILASHSLLEQRQFENSLTKLFW